MKTETLMQQAQSQPISAREMHKYVWILVGVFTLLAATFPTAFIRVSKDKKFAAYNFHVKSLTLKGQLPKPSGESPNVEPVANNPSAQTISGGNTDKTLNPSGASEGQLSKPSGESPNVEPVANNPSAQTNSSGNTDKTLNPSGASTASQETQADHSTTQTAETTTQTAEITDPDQLAALNQKLYDLVAQDWEASRRRFEQKLEYRVRVSQDGAIATYEPLNQASFDYLEQTPLPKLGKRNLPVIASSSASDSTSAPTGNITQEPLGQYKVAFTREGILEVSPWQGWRR